MSGCTLAFDGAKCGNPTVSTWESACVHEHIMPDIGFCVEHEFLALLLAWTCVKCKPDHPCLVRLRIAA